MATAGDPLSIGVDINRNFDFLFDLKKAFDPNCGLMVASDPSSDVYQGPCAFSEVETRNVRALLEKFPSTSWLIDLHSGTQKILRSWSDEDTQSTDPQQTFMDPGGNLLRGRPNNGYGEYMVQSDLDEYDRLMDVLVQSIAAANGPNYPAVSGYEFSPSSGTSHDFTYSRHLVDPQNCAKVLSFVIEWNDLPHPDWMLYMRRIVSEVTAGFVRLRHRYPVPTAVSGQFNEG
jgi:hypothetical protein